MFRAWFARIGLSSSRTADSGNAAVIPAVPSGTYPLVQFPEAALSRPGRTPPSAAPAATPPIAASTALLLTGWEDTHRPLKVCPPRLSRVTLFDHNSQQAGPSMAAR